MDALNQFDSTLRKMKQIALDLRSEQVCREEDESSVTAALAMLEMVGRRMHCNVARGVASPPPSSCADWRERQLPAGDR
ncbi:hypothetical protein [Desulfovibrio ferrophilus]|uniref:Uncharacterized protein n=1 Tax=Desulfovibrio ferrophilus TaxID=241368 RepID=A0A2Z6AYT5_9BACT|nr:hypothetical protein [Desulfovibrio ferrophilus]BBD08427.1 uncharacterized protein DFE_1701 [Desulfovibrio ferrophilus]